MPTLTLTHEAPLELIRQYPALAAEMVTAMTDVAVPADLSSARLGPTDMNNVIPVQFTADSVIVVSDATTGAPALIVVVEPQGRDDKTKKYAWPAYITNVRRAAQCERGCWPQSETRARPTPTASGSPPLFLSQRPTLPARSWRDMMTMTEWKDDFIESYVNVGLEQGLEQGFEQGLEQAKAEYVLKALDKRGLDLTAEQRHQVSVCTDLAQLDQWFDRALTAATTETFPSTNVAALVGERSPLAVAAMARQAARPAMASAAHPRW